MGNRYYGFLREIIKIGCLGVWLIFEVGIKENLYIFFIDIIR